MQNTSQSTAPQLNSDAPQLNSTAPQLNSAAPHVVIVKSVSPMRSFYSIFHTVIALFAIYLSFKCNNGFSLVDFLIACCCPALYIIYRAATSNLCAIPIGLNFGIGPKL